MFFAKDLTEVLTLHPSYFTPTLPAYLKYLLHQKVEGTCSGRLGFIIAVIGIEDKDMGRGKVVEGQAEFAIKYKAIVYRPFRGEVVDGVVASVNKMGIFAEVGPLTCFISTHVSPVLLLFHSTTYYSDAYPSLLASLFQLIPADFSFDPNANPPCFASTEDTLKIEKGTKIRLKIVGTRVDATEIFAIGTIKEDYLGPLG
ncbi:DNA-directed RNA polymerase II subunit RPB7, partial [Phenoliferia sp. Uapishka_3]